MYALRLFARFISSVIKLRKWREEAVAYKKLIVIILNGSLYWGKRKNMVVRTEVDLPYHPTLEWKRPILAVSNIHDNFDFQSNSSKLSTRFFQSTH
jgi:hypothetical protein